MRVANQSDTRPTFTAVQEEYGHVGMVCLGLVVVAFICPDISHDRNSYCVGAQAVHLIDTDRTVPLGFEGAPVFHLRKFRIYRKPFFLR